MAALVPPAVVAASGHGDGPGVVRSMVESIVGATHDKAAALGERAHAAAELATGQKLAAVAASAAALAGGGAAVEQVASERGAELKAPIAEAKKASEETPAPPVVEAPPPEPAPAPAPPAPPAPEPQAPDPANEFAPGRASPAPAATAAAPAAPSGGFAPGGGGGGTEGGGGEFGP